ncbi:MAG: 1,4-alpha-glucan branching protein GlgB [Elusimicrobia bacterium]|nr:1,4-alpha-glucan branching protein GlgB [Elusimicrobiota bacterium]
MKTATLLSDDDLHLFNEGSHLRLWERLGAHPGQGPDGEAGVHFAVWAPDAQYAAVVGDFNGWDAGKHPLSAVGSSGIWSAFIPGVAKGAHYKFHIASRHALYRADKCDPFAFHAEPSPKTASVVWDLDYEWADGDWMKKRKSRSGLDAPVSVYEVHLGSWMRVPEEGGRSLSYREIAPRLAAYASQQGFTHVEFLPVMEHPFYGSWGYQTTGYFAPTSRYGTPQDFMFLVDTLHRAGVGVILDWVPSHFPSDEHGLAFFDGTHLYEHSDPRQGWHPDWGSFIFNYGRSEVKSFLYSSALFWLEKYHIDGLRVDAVASMLYLDYSRKEGEWVPNQHGGRENLEAIEFLRRLNAEVYARHPDVQMIAEESTAWGGVSRPTYTGGLGFGLKWDMGWMHDTLEYMKKEPVHRRWHHNELTFRMIYAFHENFMLPLSHDEVVHGKGSLLRRMPGDDWQKFANLRALFAYQWSQPGKKLLFMGCEFGQWDEWNHEKSLDWHLLGAAPHQGVRKLVADLNKIYRAEPALHQLDCDPAGFQWVDASDADNSALGYLRLAKGGREAVLCVFNMTPVPRLGYRIGVPWGGRWTELLNSDAAPYGGSGVGNAGGLEAEGVPFHGRDFSLNLSLPPLGALFLKGRRP